MIDLTTDEEVKCRLETITNDFDANIATYVTDVSHRVQTFIDTDLELQSYTEIHDGGTVRLYPRRPPVISVTSVILSLSLDFGGGSLLPTADYALVNENWDVAHVSCWPGGQNAIQLIYMSGYLDASDPGSLIPKDLRAAVTKQVAYEWKYRKFDGLAVADVADGSLTLDDSTFLKSIMPILKKYRKTKLG